MILILSIGSVLLQLYAAVMAFLLIKKTGRYWAWILIALALLFMLVRRILTLIHYFTFPEYPFSIFNEVTGFLISLFLALGMTRIAPLFLSIKHAVETAKNSEKKYRQLLELANDAIYLIDMQNLKILDCNKKASEMIGFSTPELQSMNFTDIHPHIERPVLKEKLNELNSKRINPEPLILHHRKKSGSFLIVEMNVSMIEIGGQKYILSIARDITERKHAEDKIRLFFQATENSVTAVVMSDANQRITYVNPAFEKMFGYRKEEITGHKIGILYPETVFAEIEHAIRNSSEGTWMGEITGIRKGGSRFYVSVSTSPIFNDDGTVIARMTTHTDITELKLAEGKMIAYTEQLRLLSDHLTTVREEERLMLAREIHDGFGSSLTGLKLDLSILKRNISETEDLKNKPQILENIRSMADLIDQTIDLMRRLVRQLRPEILDELGLVEAIKWYASEIEKKTSLKFRITVFPRSIKTDARRTTAIFRIFQEILVNIIRHSGATEVSVFLRKQKNLIHLLVHDNGIGIQQKDIDDKRSLGILGMKERALTFGGKLQIEGGENKGTTVKLEIPIA